MRQAENAASSGVYVCRQVILFPSSIPPSALGSPYLSHGLALLKNDHSGDRFTPFWAVWLT